MFNLILFSVRLFENFYTQTCWISHLTWNFQARITLYKVYYNFPGAPDCWLPPPGCCSPWLRQLLSWSERCRLRDIWSFHPFRVYIEFIKLAQNNLQFYLWRKASAPTPTSWSELLMRWLFVLCVSERIVAPLGIISTLICGRLNVGSRNLKSYYSY